MTFNSFRVLLSLTFAAVYAYFCLLVLDAVSVFLIILGLPFQQCILGYRVGALLCWPDLQLSWPAGRPETVRPPSRPPSSSSDPTGTVSKHECKQITMLTQTLQSQHRWFQTEETYITL